MSGAAPGTYKFCQHCGQQIDRQASTCRFCGKGTGGNKFLTVVIILAVVGVVGLGSLFVIGIFAAIALPNFIGAQQKAKTASVKGNMRTFQIAVECYATDHGGVYPPSARDAALRSYFPGGSNGAAPLTPGSPSVNPFTAQPEWPVDGSVTDVLAARQMSPVMIGKGVVEYSAVFNDRHEANSYAIRGGGPTGTTIESSGTGRPLVLSNQ